MVATRSAPALRVLLQILRAQDSGDPFAFRFAPQDYILPTVGGDSPTARFDWTEDLLSDLQTIRQPGRDAAVVQRIGGRLRSFIKNGGWEAHEREIAQAVTERRRIVVTIRSSAAEMYALPWELLTLKSGQCIGEVEGLLLRFEWPESETTPEEPAPRPEGGRILLAWSAAGGEVPVGEHLQGIRAACSAGQLAFDAQADVLAHASLDALAERLDTARQSGAPVAVLHLLCHGGEVGSSFGLCMDGRDGPTIVDGADLRQALAPFSSMVRLVVLSACDSGNMGTPGNQLGSLAQTLHRCGFQAVVASRFPLSVDGSTTLTQTLYGELLAGPSSLEGALLAARKRIFRNESKLRQERRTFDWASVQLYARQADGDDTRPVVLRPYRGLLAFQPEHRRFFFGRDREAQEIAADLQALIDRSATRFLIVTGASGIGKSSLVLAGVVPMLRAADPQLVFLRMRPGADPVSALRQTLSVVTEPAKVLLLVDQFEEIFTHTTSAAVREAFLRELWTLASAPEPGVRVIVTLRVDYIGRCGELLTSDQGLRFDRVVYDEAHRCFVSQMEPEALQAAILEPARAAGLELEAGLSDRLLLDVGKEPGALPLLQDALDGLWQRRDGRRLTQAAYAALGGVVGALQGRADALVEGLTARGDAPVAQRLLVSLVAVSADTALDTRLRVPIADLQAQAGERSAQQERVLDELTSAGLLVQGEGDKVATVEIAHEALIRKWPRLRTWLAEDRAALVVQRRVRQAAKEWEQSRDESLLYRGGQLAWAAEWRKGWNARLGDVERQFLDASEALRARVKQESADRLQKEREAAERIHQLLLDSYVDRGHRLIGDGRVEEALLWLHRAYQQGSQSRALPYLLRRAMQPVDRRRAVLHVETEQALNYVVASPDGGRIVCADPGGTVQIIDVPSGRTLHTLPLGCLTAAAWSPDGARILLCTGEQASICESASGALTLQLPHPFTDAAWSADGRAIAGVTSRGSFVRCDATGGSTTIEIGGDTGRGRVLAHGKEGSILLCSAYDGIAHLIATEGMQPICQIQVDRADILAAEFDGDARRVLVITEEVDHPERVVLSVYETAEGAKLCQIGGVLRKEPAAARLAADGTRILALREPSIVSVYDAGTGQLAMELRGNSCEVTAMAFAAQGATVLAAADDQRVRIYDAAAGRPISARQTPADASVPDALCPDIATIDGRYTLYPERYNEVWVRDSKTTDVVAWLRGHESMTLFIKCSPDGRWVATTSMDCTARVWNATTFCLQAILTGHAGPVDQAQFSQDGGRVVTTSQDGSARMFDAETGYLLAHYSAPPARITTAWFAPGDRHVITRCSDGHDRVWDAGPEGRTVDALTPLIRARALVRFEPDSSPFVVANDWK